MSLFNRTFFESSGWLKVGIGEAAYAMSRGTFRTKDKINVSKTLEFAGKEGNVFHYKKDEFSVKVTVIQENSATFLSFECFPQQINRLWIHLPSHEHQGIYGCGEQFTHFNLKGKKVPIWVSEHHSLKKLIKKAALTKVFGVNDQRVSHYKHHQTYIAQPTFLTSDHEVFHVETSDYCEFDFSKSDTTTLGFRGIPKKLTHFSSADFASCMSFLAKTVHTHPKFPSWVLDGAIVASQGGWERVDLLIEKIRAKKGEVAAIWSQDFSGQIVTQFGTQVYWNWQNDSKLYPSAIEKIKQLNRDGIRFLGYINTFLKEDAPLYNEAKALGYLVLNKKNEPYLIKSTTFQAGMIDLTHPKAFEWYKQLIQREMIDIGLSGWMADFGEYLPTDAVIYDDRGAEAMHNVWPDLWARCNREAIVERGKEDEVFVFSRAGFTQTHTYSNSMWVGDQHVDFSKEYGLPSVIVAMLSLSVSGKGISHSDIGGYTTIFHMKRDEELFIRWMDANVFTPVFRTHEGNRPLSNVQVDSNNRITDHFARMSAVFKQLKPYHLSLLQEYYTSGMPLVRPMFFHFDDMHVLDVQDQYMYGSSLLVAPVLIRNATVRKVWLPEGEWEQLFTHNCYSSGWIEVDCPIGQPIAFVRKDDLWYDFFSHLSVY